MPAAPRQWPRVRRVVGCVLLVVLSTSLGGCLQPDRWAEALDKRQAESCVYVTGFVGPFVLVTIMTATGGMTLEGCHEQRP